MTIEPNGDFVLLETEEPKLAGGLTLAGSNPKLPQEYARFRVAAMGPGRMTASGEMIPMGVAIGDYVLVPPPVQISPTTPPRMPCEFVRVGEPEAEGKTLFLIHAADIMCRVSGEWHPLPSIEVASAAPRSGRKQLVH